MNTTTARFDRHMDRLVEAGAAARDKVAGIARDYRVGSMWEMESILVCVALGEMAGHTLARVERSDDSTVPAVKREVERVTEELLMGYHECRSTSTMSRALGEVQVAAARRLREELRGFLMVERAMIDEAVA